MSLSGHTPDGELLRPFVITGGRTHPVLTGLRVETQIRARDDVPSAQARFEAPFQARFEARFEARQIVELCREPHSLAELAVLLGQPLGVTRVLVADLVAAGLVSCEQPSEISVALLERILDRVRAL